jgi:hypothetical protein
MAAEYTAHAGQNARLIVYQNGNGLLLFARFS